MKKRILSDLSLGRWPADEVLNMLRATLFMRLNQNLELFESTFKYYYDSKLEAHDFKLDREVLCSWPSSYQIFLREHLSGLAPRIPVAHEIDGIVRTISQSQSWPNFSLKFSLIDGGNFFGASHPFLFGIIHLGRKFLDGDPFDRQLTIVHELGHQELFLFNTIDPIVNSPYEQNMLHGPFQGKDRPPIARMHSLFALFRMVQRERENGINKSLNSELLQKNLISFQSRELTGFGQGLVNSIQKWSQ